MTELKVLLDGIILNELTNAEQNYYENINETDKEIFMNNKRHFLDKKFKIEALKKVVMKHYEYYTKSLLEAENAEELLPTLKKIKELKEQENLKLDECIKSQYVFITISPVKTVSYLELLKYCSNFCNKKFIKSYLYVLEQRFDGEPNDKYKELGQGLHAHLLIDKGDYKPSHLKRDLERIFNNIECNKDISYRWERDLLKTQEYIIGDKNDNSKRLKQIQDRIWRQNNNIKPYYGELYK